MRQFSFHSSGGVYGEFVSDPDSGLLGELFFWGFVTKTIVENKGYPGKGWFFWGFLFGIYAMAIALIEPDMRAVREKDKSDSVIINSGGWKCGFCGYANSKDTEICRCGKDKAETTAILSELQLKEMMKKD